MNVKLNVKFASFINFRTVLLTGLLSLVAFSSWLLYFAVNGAHLFHKISPTVPNAIAYNITANNFDDNGVLKSRLFAAQMIHYPKDNTTKVLQPKVILYDANAKEEPWIITAKYANAINGTAKIILWDDVVIHQTAGKSNPDIIINTTSLTFYPKEQIAETNQPVTMTEKGQDNSVSTVKAVGIKANQKTGEIELLSNARGYYDPPKK
jgi:LPS export ABC transporter protein LptC